MYIIYSSCKGTPCVIQALAATSFVQFPVSVYGTDGSLDGQLIEVVSAILVEIIRASTRSAVAVPGVLLGT